MKEIEIFAKLGHKNIVKMFGAVIEKEDLGIVMEYCKKSLFDALFVYEEDKFTPSDKLRIIGEVGSALEYLHTHEPPIAHCDVKSQNILLDCNVTVKICDFGLSMIKILSTPLVPLEGRVTHPMAKEHLDIQHLKYFVVNC